MALIEFKNIQKKFGHFIALDQINFQIQHNEIHALIGENGAGKSTLMKLLVGMETPTQGEILLRGQSYKPTSAQIAYRHKIGLVHQHFQLADELTGWEHLFLVASVQKMNESALKKLVQKIQSQFSWKLALDLKVKFYSVGEQQRLEILRVLICEPEIIIFDEPTAVLSPDEIQEFLDFMKVLQTKGHTLILISHKLHEIKKVSDQVTILCRGQLIASHPTHQLSVIEMAEKMIGRKQLGLIPPPQQINAHQTEIQLPLSKLNLKSHEIMGVAGVDGNGQDQLIHHVLSDIQKLNITYGDISEDRYRLSLYPTQSLNENFLIRHRHQFQKNGFISSSQIQKNVLKIIQDWDVRPQEPEKAIGEFSGGNQQKFVIGRELWHNPQFIMAAHPTRGVDIGSQEKIHQTLIDEASTGKSILLISSDLDEVIKLSDRFIILFKGRIKGPFYKTQLTMNQISQIMNGLETNEVL